MIEQNAKLQSLDTKNEDVKRRILLFLRNARASYISEVAWEMNISDYDAKQFLAELWHDKLIEHIHVGDNIDPRLFSRVLDQSLKGQGGRANFSRKQWFGITDAGRTWLITQ